MRPLAEELAAWAVEFDSRDDDRELARRALVDTVAVAVAARSEPVTRLACKCLEESAAWATAAHALDYDDLHMPSTSHISAVCVPAALAAGGGERAYLAGAGVMARLGTALGWAHYRRGWHATCTAGALAAAVTAGVAAGLDAGRLAVALALAVPAAGGVQRSFGTMAKPLQVGFAVAAGRRAALLAASGASADITALDEWFALVGGSRERFTTAGSVVPGRLAIKVYPCCYALQRPIAATATLAVPVAEVERIVCRTPAGALQPLIHSAPRTGLEAKFSLEYGVAAALLDRPVGFASFTDDCVRRPEAQRLAALVAVEAQPGGEGLLEGEFQVTVHLRGGRQAEGVLDLPPGAPGRPPSPAELRQKVADCCGEAAGEVMDLSWASAPDLLRHTLG